MGADLFASEAAGAALFIKHERGDVLKIPESLHHNTFIQRQLKQQPEGACQLRMIPLGTFPDDSLAGLERVAFPAEISFATFGTNRNLFAAIRTVRLHFDFVKWSFPTACLTKDTDTFRRLFSGHFSSALATDSSQHDGLPED